MSDRVQDVGAAPRKKPARFLVKLALAGLSFTVAMLVGEVALRIRRSSDKGGFEASAELERLRKAASPITEVIAGAPPIRDASGRVVEPGKGHQLSAYTGFDGPTRDQMLARELNAMAHEDGEFDILVFGGSVALQFESDVGTELTELLAADAKFAGRKVRVFSHAYYGFKQPQQLCALVYALSLGVDADLVLNLDGFNEIALGLDNAARGVHPVTPSIVHWSSQAGGARLSGRPFDLLVTMRTIRSQAESELARVQRWGLQRSALLGALFESHFALLADHYGTAFAEYSEQVSKDEERRYAVGPAVDTKDAARMMETCERIWFESSCSMDALCRARSIRYVQALQPNLFDSGSKVLSDTEGETVRVGGSPQRTGVRLAYPQMRELGKELRRRGVEFHDLTNSFEGLSETLYVDQCHLNHKGNELLVQRVAAVLIDPDAP